jgi:hypothetical protein
MEMPHTVELVAAGMCFGIGIACCAGSWRTMLGSKLPLASAFARYGVGSLANSFLPARAGDAVRMGLFSRVSPGGMLAVAGAVAAVGIARWLALLPLGAAGVVDSSLPPLAIALAAVAVLPLAAAWLLARRGSRRARALLAPLRSARRETYCALAGWVLGTLAARVAAATLAADALGITHPFLAALLVVPALELTGIVPLTPANIGVAGGAAAMAFHAHGTPMRTALAAGLALHAVETAAGIAVGATSFLSLLVATRMRPHRDSPDKIVTGLLPALRRVSAHVNATAR